MTLTEYLSKLGRGGKDEFAKKIGVSKSFLRQMETGTSKVPPPRALAIEKHTNGLVTKTELRPDLWGN